MRVMAGGGRGSEPRLPGPGGAGAVTVGTRTLSEGGAAGKWSREEVRESCVLCCVMLCHDPTCNSRVARCPFRLLLQNTATAVDATWLRCTQTTPAIAAAVIAAAVVACHTILNTLPASFPCS